MESFAILGAHHAISCEEIFTTTGMTPSFVCPSFARYTSDFSDPSSLIERLGGTQKIGSCVTTLATDITDDALFSTLLQTLLDTDVSSSKIQFGLSVYGTGSFKARIVGSIPRLGISLKKALVAAGKSARVVANAGEALSAASILANKLVGKGVEIVLLCTETDVTIGVTQGVQDIDAWTLHDRGRPRTNAKQGMLPPKLARMMLNLAGISYKGATVLDPFCGSGTVLMEAGFLGAHHLLGSDVEEMAVSDTETNLLWAKSTLHLSSEITCVVASAKNAPAHFAPASVHAIVTEPYLGRPRKGNETHEDIEKSVAYLTTLYEESFAALRMLLAPGARVVIASPVHFLEEASFAVPTTEILSKIGYTPLPFSQPLLYRHEGQFVGRELLRFTLS